MNHGHILMRNALNVVIAYRGADTKMPGCTIYNLRVSKRVRSIKSISTFVERKQLSEYI